IFRNGPSIALLAVCSIRVGSFASLTLGHSFLRIDDGWWIGLAANETKSGRPDERPAPGFLTWCVDELSLSQKRRTLVFHHRHTNGTKRQQLAKHRPQSSMPGPKRRRTRKGGNELTLSADL